MTSFSQDEESFLFRLKKEFSSIFSGSNPSSASSSSITNDFIIPASVFASKSSNRSKLWIEEKIKPLVAEECSRLRQKILLEGESTTSSSSSSSSLLCNAVIEEDLYRKFLKAIDFLTAVTFPFEQNAKTQCYFNNNTIKIFNNDKKNSNNNLPLREQLKKIFVANFLLSSSSSSSSMNALDVKKFINAAAAIMVKKIFDHVDLEENNHNNRLKISIDCFGLLSGFRQTLVSKMRRELEKSLGNNNTNQENENENNGKTASSVACAIYEKIESVQRISKQLFHHQDPLLEFYVSTSSSTSLSFQHKFVTYSPVDIVLIKTIKRVMVLGSCDSVGDDEVNIVNKAITDNILRDKEHGIDQSILRQFHRHQVDEQKNVPWKMIQIAGEEAIANILARRIQNHVAMSLEKFRQEQQQQKKNSDDENREIVIRTCFLPWLQFALCDHCFCSHPTNTNNNKPSSCPLRLCSANHALIASAVREGLRGVFQMLRFETFVTRTLLLEIDAELRRTINLQDDQSVVYLYRLLQSLTTLPSHYDSDGHQHSLLSGNNNNLHSDSSSLLNEKKSWITYFHNLALQRILDNNRNSRELFLRELECARLLQLLCDPETQFYPRKYRGMIAGYLACQKLLQQNIKEEENNNNSSLIVIPQHFMPTFDDDLIPRAFRSSENNNSEILISKAIPIFTSSNIFFLSAKTDFTKMIQNATSTYTKLFWLPNEGSASASLKCENSSSSTTTALIVRGSPLQIALLHLIGNNNKTPSLSIEQIQESLFPGMTTSTSTKDLIQNALKILENSKLVSTTSLSYVAPTSAVASKYSNAFFMLPSPSKIVENIVSNSSLQTTSATTSKTDRRVFIETILSQKISQIGEEIAKNKRTGRPTATATSNNQSTEAAPGVDDDLTSLAARTRSQSQERGTNNNNNVNLISPTVIKCHALRLVKRAGKLKMSQWLEATRHLVKYNISASVFENVVDKLVEGEFVSKTIVAAANEGQQEEIVYEYLP